jgi:hypothetical protein
MLPTRRQAKVPSEIKEPAVAISKTRSARSPGTQNALRQLDERAEHAFGTQSAPDLA